MSILNGAAEQAWKLINWYRTVRHRPSGHRAVCLGQVCAGPVRDRRICLGYARRVHRGKRIFQSTDRDSMTYLIFFESSAEALLAMNIGFINRASSLCPLNEYAMIFMKSLTWHNVVRSILVFKAVAWKPGAKGINKYIGIWNEFIFARPENKLEIV